jgi:hypothetical protein
LATLAIAVGACGISTDEAAGPAEVGDELAQVDLDGLRYTVRVSRTLNPQLSEDQAYLRGLPDGFAKPGPQQLYFAVFLAVHNPTDVTIDATPRLTISDAQGHVYRRIPLTRNNAWAYQPGRLGPGQRIPAPSSVAQEGPAHGALALYKINVSAYQDRPLELVLHSNRSSQTARVQLDL